MAFVGNRCLFVLSAFQKTLLNYHNVPFHLFHGKGSRTCRISRSHVGTHSPCVHSDGPASRLLAHAFSCSTLGGGADLVSLRGPYPPDFPKPFVDNAQAFKSEKTIQCRLQAAFIRHSVSQQERPSHPVDIQLNVEHMHEIVGIATPFHDFTMGTEHGFHLQGTRRSRQSMRIEPIVIATLRGSHDAMAAE